MPVYEFFLTSSLEKVFADQRPAALHTDRLNGLIGDRIAFQLVYSVQKNTEPKPQEFTVEVSGIDVPIRLRDVVLMPSHYPVTEKQDGNYLRTEPGLYPNLLLPSSGRIIPVRNQFRSLWIDADLSGAKPGVYRLCVTIRTDETIMQELPLTVEVIDCALPEQELIHTEWFHTDCIADYYHVPVFSEQHWDSIEKFITAAAHDCGINMLLTPVFTPPLDTAVGGERTTVQLVSIARNGDAYSFDFTLLKRWCELCKKAGITHLEIPPFFTQWGAAAASKIVVTVDGTETKLFGWHTAASDPEYLRFLSSFIPQLLHALHSTGFDKDHLIFHVSDEPNESTMSGYRAAKEILAPLLDGYTIMDALSSYEFYEKGLVAHPIPANDSIQPFIDHKVENLWVYYCVSQGIEVPNRFFAMPSARNRIMGVLMYLYNIRGFLHWGFNFYNTQFSKKTYQSVYHYRLRFGIFFRRCISRLSCSGRRRIFFNKK